jgi:hypothetical protein
MGIVKVPDLSNFSEERFTRWKQEMIDELDYIKDEISVMKYDPNSPGTTKRACGIVEMKIKAVDECFPE